MQIDYVIQGAIKIKDGLFIGDEFAAQVIPHFFLFYYKFSIFYQDEELIFSNKITHIINCAANDIPNNWEHQGVAYLSFHWEESDDQVKNLFFFFII